MKFIAIIPARYASTRFPGKPLVDMRGKTMIQRVYEQVSSCLSAVYVATDDARICQAVHDFNDQDLKKGVGVGIRWQSPLGPIKLDIAKPVGDPDKNGFEFYIGLGPEL